MINLVTILLIKYYEFYKGKLFKKFNLNYIFDSRNKVSLYFSKEIYLKIIYCGLKKVMKLKVNNKKGNN